MTEPETELPVIKPATDQPEMRSEEMGLFSVARSQKATPLIIDLGTADDDQQPDHFRPLISSQEDSGTPPPSHDQQHRPLIEFVSSQEDSGTPPPSHDQQPGHFRPLIEFVSSQEDSGTPPPSHDQQPGHFRPLIEFVSSQEDSGTPPPSHDQQPGHFRPLIEFVSSQEEPPTLERKETPPTKRDSVRTRPPQPDTAPNLPFDVPEATETAFGGEWASPPSKPLAEELKDGETHQDIIVEELKDGETHQDIIVEDLDTELDDEMGIPMKDRSHVHLADIPLITDESQIQEFDAVLEKLWRTPESQLTPEDKIWQLATKAGSTLEADQVKLDPEAKQRLRDRLKETGTLDKVSLSF